MRNKVLWRLTPSPSEEIYIRDAAKREGRPLAGMIHKLISEAILARQMAASQVSEVSRTRGDHSRRVPPTSRRRHEHIAPLSSRDFGRNNLIKCSCNSCRWEKVDALANALQSGNVLAVHADGDAIVLLAITPSGRANMPLTLPWSTA